jgi:broad specificity phosphatase PhoE
MPAIVLIRHGPISLDLDSPVEAGRVVDLLDEADASGIRPDCPPPAALLRLVRDADCFLSSDLRRSKESAVLIAQGRTVQADPLYREIPLLFRLPGKLRLRPAAFFWTLRLLRHVGLHGDGESIGAVRHRAAAAAAALGTLAASHPTVVLLAHAMINRQIARALRQEGWKGPRRTGSRHWEATVYSRD